LANSLNRGASNSSARKSAKKGISFDLENLSGLQGKVPKKKGEVDTREGWVTLKDRIQERAYWTESKSSTPRNDPIVATPRSNRRGELLKYIQQRGMSQTDRGPSGFKKHVS
jgi:hypothetical protein